MPDKFKGTLTSAQAGRAIARGLRRMWPKAQFTIAELSDGGDGFARLLVRAAGGKLHRMQTVDAAGRACRAVWGTLPRAATAVLDIASASGLAQLPPRLRNPANTSSYGTGLVLRRAIASGARTIVIGLGGTATNDGGIGMAAAMGYRFLDRRGKPIALTGGGLSRLATIVPPDALPRVKVIAATDVDNPLYGAHGATRQFGAQKGADARTLDVLERGMRALANVARRDLNVNFADAPGAGAAGGAGYGLMTFFGAERVTGFEVVRELLRLDHVLAKHDLVVTGEGCFDRTSLAGKAPICVAQLAREVGTPAWGIFGQVKLRATKAHFERVGAIANGATTPSLAAPAVVHAARLADVAARLARQQ